MGEDTEKTLWGFPVVATDAVTPGIAIVGPMPTWRDVLRYGSFAKAIEARAEEYSKITGINSGPILNTED